MASVQVFSFNRCSTCRKALAWLTEKGIDHDVIDITEKPPTGSAVESDAPVRRPENPFQYQWAELQSAGCCDR